MFYYKYKSVTIVAGLLLGLLSLDAGAPPMPMERVLYNNYQQVILEGRSTDWVQRIIGWRIDYTCRQSAGCYLAILDSSSMMMTIGNQQNVSASTCVAATTAGYYSTYSCPYRTKVYLLHENFVIPPTCTLQPMTCE